MKRINSILSFTEWFNNIPKHLLFSIIIVWRFEFNVFIGYFFIKSFFQLLQFINEFILSFEFCKFDELLQIFSSNSCFRARWNQFDVFIETITYFKIVQKYKFSNSFCVKSKEIFFWISSQSWIRILKSESISYTLSIETSSCAK